MKVTLALVRYQFLVLARTPGYWITSLVLAVLGIVVFGLFLTDPTGPRLGIVDQAQNEAAAQFISAAEDLDRVNVRVGDLDEQLDNLSDGERWAIVVLPPGFGEQRALSGVDLYTSSSGAYSTLTGSGIIRQLLIDTTGADAGAGIGVRAEAVGGDEPLEFIEVIVPGQVGLSLMFGNLFAAVMLVTWRQQGILRRLAVSPARPVHVLASQLIVFGALSALQSAILLTLGVVLFGVTIHGSILAVAATAALGLLAFLTLWYALAAVIRSPIGAISVANLIAFVMLFAGGSYVPIDDPPLFLEPVVIAAPLTYLNGALREIINDGEGFTEIAPELAVLAAWVAVLFSVSMRLFRWTAEE